MSFFRDLPLDPLDPLGPLGPLGPLPLGRLKFSDHILMYAVGGPQSATVAVQTGGVLRCFPSANLTRKQTKDLIFRTFRVSASLF